MPFAAVNGTRLHYHVTGRGLPILFIHPPLLNQANFNYQRAQLSDRYKIITFDIRGHGRSSASKAPITYPLITEDMKQLLDFLEVKQAVVCGYSTGGSAALEALLTYPDHFIGGVLLSGMSEVSDWKLRNKIRLGSALASLRAKRVLSGVVGWGNADMNKTFENLYKGAIQGNIQNIRQYYSYSLKYRCTHRLQEINQPVLLLYGDQDAGFFRYADILHKGLPHNTLHYIKGVSHQIPTKAPRSMARLVDRWVREHFGGDGGKPRFEAFVQDMPDFLSDADTPSAQENLQEL